MAEAALIMASEEYPQLEVSPYLDKLGRIADAAQELLRADGSLAFDERFLARVTNRQILWRMLNNLKDIYLKAHAFDKGLTIVDMMLMVEPEDATQFRDRGLLRLQLRQFEGAARDLEHYVRHSQSTEDRKEMEDHLKELKRIRAMMN
ncbi:MAG: tetratricopeptide repeat protein [Acidobacteria bacterium]|nr:tetratricopeptide repeat protein [Acidobacteriota bacterium]